MRLPISDDLWIEVQKAIDIIKREIQHSPNQLALVTFTKTLEPEFVWEDGKVYGPFQKGDLARIPYGLAEFLLKKGAVKIWEPRYVACDPNEIVYLLADAKIPPPAIFLALYLLFIQNKLTLEGGLIKWVS